MKRALHAVAALKDLLTLAATDELTKIGSGLNLCQALLEEIERTISDEAPTLIAKGNAIKDKVDTTLDEYRYLMRDGERSDGRITTTRTRIFRNTEPEVRI